MIWEIYPYYQNNREAKMGEAKRRKKLDPNFGKIPNKVSLKDLSDALESVIGKGIFALENKKIDFIPYQELQDKKDNYLLSVIDGLADNEIALITNNVAKTITKEEASEIWSYGNKDKMIALTLTQVKKTYPDLIS